MEQLLHGDALLEDIDSFVDDWHEAPDDSKIASLSLEDWKNFARVHGQRLLGDAPVYMPWLLDGAGAETETAFLANVPPQLAGGYRGGWAADYAARKLWDGS